MTWRRGIGYHSGTRSRMSLRHKWLEDVDDVTSCFCHAPMSVNNANKRHVIGRHCFDQLSLKGIQWIAGSSREGKAAKRQIAWPFSWEQLHIILWDAPVMARINIRQRYQEDSEYEYRRVEPHPRQCHRHRQGWGTGSDLERWISIEKVCRDKAWEESVAIKSEHKTYQATQPLLCRNILEANRRHHNQCEVAEFQVGKILGIHVRTLHGICGNMTILPR